jgi:Holliday junction resolvase RusA-like endonuclease
MEPVNQKKHKQPKTIRLFIKGEVVEETIAYRTESGELLEYDKIRRILVPSKKNQKEMVRNPHNGRTYLLTSRQYMKWKKEHGPIFQRWRDKLLEDDQVRLPIVRCDIKILFYYPDKKVRDNGNKYQTIVDALKEAEIIADDSFMVFNNESQKGRVRRDKPRTEIYITIIPPDHPDYEWDETPASYADRVKKKKVIQRKIQRDKRKTVAPS